jgi:hypothetical protein
MSGISFKSFFMAGFECSSHRRVGDGARLDLVAATGHDRLVREDYQACAAHGLRTVRDGLRWHLIEREPGRSTGRAGCRCWRRRPRPASR